MRTVEVESAGEDVGAGQSHERQLGTVCAAADGADLRLYAGLHHSLLDDVDDVHHGLYLLAHVVVLVFEVQNERALSILAVHALHEAFHHLLACFEPLPVVVADNVADSGLLHSPFDAGKVEESLIAFILEVFSAT